MFVVARREARFASSRDTATTLCRAFALGRRHDNAIDARIAVASRFAVAAARVAIDQIACHKQRAHGRDSLHHGAAHA